MFAWLHLRRKPCQHLTILSISWSAFVHNATKPICSWRLTFLFICMCFCELCSILEMIDWLIWRWRHLHLVFFSATCSFTMKLCKITLGSLSVPSPGTWTMQFRCIAQKCTRCKNNSDYWSEFLIEKLLLYCKFEVMESFIGVKRRISADRTRVRLACQRSRESTGWLGSP